MEVEIMTNNNDRSLDMITVIGIDQSCSQILNGPEINVANFSLLVHISSNTLTHIGTIDKMDKYRYM